ncbi:hypothetical protein MKX01_037725 [Papaver californicum]|nr:hypothetical protein MKX01_037725 [Papaver californicum]
MDLSSLTEAQQQQIQQLHQQFQEHQIQRQKEQQELAAAASYDPSSQHHFHSYNQSIQQTYDQSYHHPSYSHYPQQQQHHQHQQQHYPAYYHHDYSNAYHHHHQSYSQTDTTPPIQPPGVSSEAAVASQNAYYPPPHSQPLGNPSTSSDYPGLNPAAAAAVEAFSQLTQFARNMDAAERAMASGLQDRQWNPPNNELGGVGVGTYSQMPMPLHHGPYPIHVEAGRPPYDRGGVKRGGRTFRGSSRGNFGNRNSNGSAPYSRGRGRGGKGVGGGRCFPWHCDSLSPFPEASAQKSDSASTHLELAQSGKTGTDEPPQTTPASASSTAATTTTSVQATQSTKRPPGISWCELCRVDCTSPDILEQHKNGKKHKKNLLRFEVVQNFGNHTSNPTPSQDLPSVQTEKITTGDQEATAHHENIHPNESINQPDLKSLATETTTPDEQRMDSEQQNKVLELAAVPELDKTEGTTKRQKVDQFDTSKRALKRKLRGGRGGKRMRMAEHKISRVIEPPKEVLPVSCDLCNVKCDTQAVLECHLVGKKHLSKMRRFQGHQSMYGPVGLQVLYPPISNTQSVFIPREHHQQQAPVNIPSHQPIVAYGMPLDGHAAAVMQQGQQF